MAASLFSPSIPPPTPRSSLLHLPRSWPSCAPGVVSTSSSCSTSGLHVTPWILPGPWACLKWEFLLPAREWTVWGRWIWTRWSCGRTRPSSSNCLRQEATRRAVWRMSRDLSFPPSGWWVSAKLFLFVCLFFKLWLVCAQKLQKKWWFCVALFTASIVCTTPQWIHWACFRNMTWRQEKTNLQFEEKKYFQT